MNAYWVSTMHQELGMLRELWLSLCWEWFLLQGFESLEGKNFVLALSLEFYNTFQVLSEPLCCIWWKKFLPLWSFSLP